MHVPPILMGYTQRKRSYILSFMLEAFHGAFRSLDYLAVTLMTTIEFQQKRSRLCLLKGHKRKGEHLL